MSKKYHSKFLPKDFAPHLEKIRQKLAENFGVTVQGHHLTLRCEIEGVHTELSALVSDVRMYVDCCDRCGQPFRSGSERYPVKVEVKHDGQVVKRETAEICYGCAQ